MIKEKLLCEFWGLTVCNIELFSLRSLRTSVDLLSNGFTFEFLQKGAKGAKGIF